MNLRRAVGAVTISMETVWGESDCLLLSLLSLSYVDEKNKESTLCIAEVKKDVCIFAHCVWHIL